jgi:predicted phosphodiesterase
LTDSLLGELLAKPVGPTTPAQRVDSERDFTRQIEVSGETAEVTVRGAADDVSEDAATAYLRAQGLDPAEWTATGFRSSEWSMANGETGVSTRFTFARSAAAVEDRPPLDELIEGIGQYHAWMPRALVGGSHAFIVALGDLQLGKVDGDGVEGTVNRTVNCLNKAADLLELHRQRFDIGHVHLAFLGDHVEGFASQGGSNVWRTPLTLTEQIRLTRRIMLHAALTFAPLAQRVTMAAVPGNHGEAVRINNRGLTRYDDSHDTESLIAVKDALDMAPEKFGHVECLVPDTDELTVVVECSGTVVAHAHGHQWKPARHFEWWRGQAFNQESAMHRADLLLAGHQHHELVDTDGSRTFVQVPAMESESTWWRHRTGTTGAPGLMVLVTKDGATNLKEVVR